jgi:hypothetical protein
MDPFFSDINSSMAGEGSGDMKKIRYVFEYHTRFLEGAGSTCSNSDSTMLLSFASQFRNAGNFVCAVLCLDIQIDCLPDTATGAFANESVQLFRDIDSDTVKATLTEGLSQQLYSIIL